MIDFSRTCHFLDLDLLKHTQVSIAGTGGASELAVDLVRCGVHQLTLVDPDTYEPCNLATQGGTLADLGQPKVTALARRLRAINPTVRVTTYRKRYEELTPEEHEQFWAADLALMMTDCFPAQAQGNRDALAQCTPTLFAGAYLRMDAVEITWNAPGLTTHCHRCVTLSRYQAYAKGYALPSAAGSHVFAGRQLNAMLGQLALSLIHHYGDSDYPIAELVRSLGANNFLLTKLLPDFGVANGIFATRTPFATRAFAPDAPADYTCPDCGASGVSHPSAPEGVAA